MKKFHAGSILLGTILLIVLVWKIGPENLWRDLSLLGWGLVPFVLIEGVVAVLHTLGWRYCLSSHHRSLPFFRLLGINLAGNSINYFTPTATLGGEVIKGTLLSSYRHGTEAATGVIIGKLSYALAQLLFVVLGSTLILWRLHLPVAGTAAMLAASALLGAGIVGFLIVQKCGKLGGVVRWLVVHKVGGKLLEQAAQQISRVDQALQVFYRERPWDLLLSMLWHAAGMTCSIGKTWYFLLLLTDGPLFAAAGIWFLGTWFDLLTFSIPLGIGVQEGTRVIAFNALGYSLALGLTFGIALRLEQLFWGGVGLFFYAVLWAAKRERGVFPEKEIASDESITRLKPYP